MKIKPITGGGARPETAGSSEEYGGRRFGHVPTRLSGGIPDDGPRGSSGVVMSASARARGLLSASCVDCLDCAARCDGPVPSVVAELDSHGDGVEVNGDSDLKRAARP